MLAGHRAHLEAQQLALELLSNALADDDDDANGPMTGGEDWEDMDTDDLDAGAADPSGAAVTGSPAVAAAMAPILGMLRSARLPLNVHSPLRSQARASASRHPCALHSRSRNCHGRELEATA